MKNVLIEDVSGRMEGAINMVAQHQGEITDIVLRDVNMEQAAGPLGTGLSYDMRPTIEDRFDRFPLGDKSAGRVNAWRYGPDGKIIGLIAYEGGIPGVFAKGVTGLVTENVVVMRPNPLPEVGAPTPLFDFPQRGHVEYRRQRLEPALRHGHTSPL